MPSLSVSVPLTPAYNQAYEKLVVVNQTSAKISVDLQDGTHTYTTPYQTVGTLKFFANPQLQAAIRFTYTYDPSDGTLDLYGNDYVSSQSTCLLTRPAGSTQVCSQYTYPGQSSPCGANPNWSYTTPYTPGLAAELAATVRTANTQIIAAASAVVPTVRVLTPPPAPESIEEAHRWMAMYDKDGNHLGQFDPEAEYPDGTTMVNVLQSAWGGTVKFNQNENIANVKGSSQDPKLPGSKPWIEVWERQFGMEQYCTSHDWASGGPFQCNDGTAANRIGGHVLVGTVAKTMPAGSDDVYIIPICKNHNNNDSVYMRANVYTQGIWLKNYLGT